MYDNMHHTPEYLHVMNMHILSGWFRQFLQQERSVFGSCAFIWLRCALQAHKVRAIIKQSHVFLDESASHADASHPASLFSAEADPTNCLSNQEYPLPFIRSYRRGSDNASRVREAYTARHRLKQAIVLSLTKRQFPKGIKPVFAAEFGVNSSLSHMTVTSAKNASDKCTCAFLEVKVEARLAFLFGVIDTYITPLTLTQLSTELDKVAQVSGSLNLQHWIGATKATKDTSCTTPSWTPAHISDGLSACPALIRREAHIIHSGLITIRGDESRSYRVCAVERVLILPQEERLDSTNVLHLESCSRGGVYLCPFAPRPFTQLRPEVCDTPWLHQPGGAEHDTPPREWVMRVRRPPLCPVVPRHSTRRRETLRLLGITKLSQSRQRCDSPYPDQCTPRELEWSTESLAPVANTLNHRPNHPRNDYELTETAVVAVCETPIPLMEGQFGSVRFTTATFGGLVVFAPGNRFSDRLCDPSQEIMGLRCQASRSILEMEKMRGYVKAKKGGFN